MMNIAMNDQFIPIFSTTRFKLNMRYVGKISGGKKQVFLTNIQYVGKFMK